MTENRDQGLQLQNFRVLASQSRLEAFHALTQNAWIFPWVNREPVLVIEDAERPCSGSNASLSPPLSRIAP